MASVRVPTPDFDTASARLEDLLEALVADGHDVTIASTRPDSLGELAERVARDEARLSGKGVRHAPERDLRAHLASDGGSYDVVIASYLEAAYLIADLLDEHASQARTIYDTVDVHHLRLFRIAKLTGNRPMLQRALRAKAQEIATVERYDHTIAVSEVELRLLRSLCPEASLSVLGCRFDLAESPPPLTDRVGTVFVANYLNLPNEDAMVHYVTDIIPLLSAAGAPAGHRIVGGGVTPAVEALARQGVDIVGWVPSVGPELDRARVFVAPLRFGSGIKGKVLEAMAHGLPVVTTSIGAEGLGLQHGRDALVADTPAEFAHAVQRLLTDDGLWQRVADAGRTVVRKSSSAESFRGATRAALRAIDR